MLILVVLFGAAFVDAGVKLFPYYDEDVFTAKKIYTPSSSLTYGSFPILFSSLFAVGISFTEGKNDNEQNKEKAGETVEVLIKNTYFDPKEVQVKVN